jgi:hypothetical protein
MLKYILYFLAAYIALAAILFLLSIFDILPSNLNSGFSAVITIASAVLPAYKFVKDFERVPSIKEDLIFGFGAAISSEVIGLIVILPFAEQLGLNLPKEISVYIFLPLFIVFIKAIAAAAFFGFYAKLTIKDIVKK